MDGTDDSPRWNDYILWHLIPSSVLIFVSFHFLAKFSVYDGMAFPEKQPSSIIKTVGKFVGAVADYITGQETEKELVVPNHGQVQEECLYIFLEDHRKLLTNLDFTRKKVQVTYSMCVDEIYVIFEQLRVQSLCRELVPSGKNRVAESLAKVRTDYRRTEPFCWLLYLDNA